MILTLILLASMAEAATIFNEHDSPWIIFNHLNKIALANDEWKIIFYHDIKPITTEERKIYAMSTTLKELCEHLTKHSSDQPSGGYCSFIIFLIEAHKNRMTRKKYTIDSYVHHRNRRAPIEFVGSIAKGLFGILDAESANLYNK